MPNLYDEPLAYDEAFGYDASPPAAPANLTATAGASAIALAWDASSGATSYNLYRSLASGAEALVISGIASTSYSDTSVTAGVAYFYKVTAVGTGGESDQSNEATATVEASAVVTATPASGNVSGASLEWGSNQKLSRVEFEGRFRRKESPAQPDKAAKAAQRREERRVREEEELLAIG